MAPLTNDHNRLKLISFTPNEYIKADPTETSEFTLTIENNEPHDVIVKVCFPKVTLVKVKPRMLLIGSREKVDMNIIMKAFDVSIGKQFLKFKIKVVGVRELDDRERPTEEEIWDSGSGRGDPKIWQDYAMTYIHTKLLFVRYAGMNKRKWWKKGEKYKITWGIAKEDLPEEDE